MLLQNATNYASNPITLTGGTLAGEAIYLGLRDQTFLAFAGSVDRKAAIPEGYGPGDAWFPAILAGGLAAGSESVMAETASISGARNIEAAASIELSSTAAGSLIASMTASSSSALTVDATIFSIQIASIEASASIALASSSVISAIASIEAAGSASIAGTVTQRANAFMVASAGGPEALSPQGLASAVWGAIDSENNTAGTMGAKVNAAASAGDPWTTVVPGSYPVGSAGWLIAQLALQDPETATKLDEVWKRLGLDVANPLVNTDTLISAGTGVQLQVTETPTTTTTARLP
jgi:hypothetical protein